MAHSHGKCTCGDCYMINLARSDNMDEPVHDLGGEEMPKAMEHKPLPVAGYTAQSDARLKAVNANKELEENVLRALDFLKGQDVDQRWLAIGRTHIEQAFMAINRAIFQPQRIKLPEDGK